MKAIISPSIIKGQLIVPSSKSSMQRACALALLHRGTTVIENPGKSNDDLKAIGIIRSLGAEVKETDNLLTVISGGIKPVADSIDCGESGLSFRMFSVIAGLYDGIITINASGSLLKRPIGQLHEILTAVGVEVLSEKGKFPLKIKGPIKPSAVTVDGSQSSQYITGLLIAFAAAARERIELNVSNLASRPYVDLTLSMLHHFGYNISHDNYEKFFIEPSANNIAEINYQVESDWSSASFLIVAGAIAGDISLRGLDINSTQADRGIMEVLEKCGATYTFDDGTLTVHRSSLQAFEFDATDCPDLFPPLAALAVYCDGVSKIKGTNRLTHKESNRAESIIQEFSKMNVEVTVENDVMTILGKQAVKGAAVHSHHDHRIAMALAVLGLKAGGDTQIENADAINKSYPGFYDDMQKLGAFVSLIN